MDIKQRVMDDQPNSLLHKIAGIIPGYKGYVDRERRRDADKLLRTHIGRQFSAQRDRLNRVQQSLLRARRMDALPEVDRLAGVLGRVIDRINTASYGYTGLFDPVKIEAEDLDQLYAFDMSLASGVDQVSSAVSVLEDEEEAESLNANLRKLSTLLDDLNERLNQRSELLTSGKRLPQGEYQSLLDNLEPLPPLNSGKKEVGTRNVDRETPTGTGTLGNAGGYIPASAGMSGGVGASNVTTYTEGASMGNKGSSSTENASAAGMSSITDAAGAASGEAGVPTTNLNLGRSGPPEPGMSSLTEGNDSMTGMPHGEGMGDMTGGAMTSGDSAGGALQSASSPGAAPGAPGGDIVDGLKMERNMSDALDVDSEGGTVGSKN